MYMHCTKLHDATHYYNQHVAFFSEHTWHFQFLSSRSCLLRVNGLITIIGTLCVALWLNLCQHVKERTAHSMHEELLMCLLVYTKEDDNLM